MLEIKTEDGKGLRARAIVGNTSRCGVCDMVLLDGQEYFMLDDPYNCLVHRTCINFMEWDGKLRAQGPDHDARAKQISDDEHTIGEYMRKAHWNVLKIPRAVREAWTRFYFLGLMLRQSYEPPANQVKRDALMRRVATALNLLPPPQPLEQMSASVAPAVPTEAATMQHSDAAPTTTPTPSPTPSPNTESTGGASAAARADAPFAGNVFAP